MLIELQEGVGVNFVDHTLVKRIDIRRSTKTARDQPTYTVHICDERLAVVAQVEKESLDEASKFVVSLAETCKVATIQERICDGSEKAESQT